MLFICLYLPDDHYEFIKQQKTNHRKIIDTISESVESSSKLSCLLVQLSDALLAVT